MSAETIVISTILISMLTPILTKNTNKCWFSLSESYWTFHSNS